MIVMMMMMMMMMMIIAPIQQHFATFTTLRRKSETSQLFVGNPCWQLVGNPSQNGLLLLAVASLVPVSTCPEVGEDSLFQMVSPCPPPKKKQGKCTSTKLATIRAVSSPTEDLTAQRHAKLWKVGCVVHNYIYILYYIYMFDHPLPKNFNSGIWVFLRGSSKVIFYVFFWDYCMICLVTCAY